MEKHYKNSDAAHVTIEEFSEAGPSPLDDAIAALNRDDLTPKAALEALYKLKELALLHPSSRKPRP